MTTDFDVIVVGAGFAGITAARELHTQGRRTLLLEARDRIGGRTYTGTFAGELVELGGAWIHWSQPYIWTELTRYGISIVRDAVAERAIFPGPYGFRSYPADEIIPRQEELLGEFFAGVEEYFPRPYEPLFRKDLLAEVDQLSLRDRISQLNLSPEDEGLLTGLMSGESGGSSARGALTMPAHWWALGGLAYYGFNAILSFRPETGMRGLLDAMLTDASAELRLNTPVTSIADDGERVQVTTRAGERFSAQAAVVAVPVNSWQTIDFIPKLPEPYLTASTDGIGVPNAIKLAIHLRGDIGGPFYAQGEEGDPIIGLFPQRQLDDGQLVVGFIVEESVDVTDFKQVEAAVHHLEPKAEVIDYQYYDWGRDEFSQGGWAWRQPGQLLQLGTIQQPQGRLAFASGDIPSGWSGCVDGAIESGIKAARYAARLVE